jgi:hypothetical protein
MFLNMFIIPLILPGPPPTKFGVAMAASSPMIASRRTTVSNQERIDLGLASESIIYENTGEAQRLLAECLDNGPMPAGFGLATPHP